MPCTGNEMCSAQRGLRGPTQSPHWLLCHDTPQVILLHSQQAPVMLTFLFLEPILGLTSCFRVLSSSLHRADNFSFWPLVKVTLGETFPDHSIQSSSPETSQWTWQTGQVYGSVLTLRAKEQLDLLCFQMGCDRKHPYYLQEYCS